MKRRPAKSEPVVIPEVIAPEIIESARQALRYGAPGGTNG